MYLFFDTETSGLPKDWKAPVTNTANWPRLVQLGWTCCDTEGRLVESQEHLIRPVGFRISSGATKTHGITTEQALTEGVDLSPVLVEFHQAVQKAKCLVAHNIAFDENIVGAEFLRAEMDNILPDRERRCTMRESTDYCKIPGPRGYKWPTLTELHEKLFGEAFENAHGAIADCSACMRCFFRLRELGAVS